MNPQLVSCFLYHTVRLLGKTLRLQVVGEDAVSAIQAESGAGVILVTWHGRTLIPITQYQKRGYWSMISTSRDGEYQDHLFRRFGFNTVRGSSSARGAVQSTLTMVKHLKAGAVLAFTPDGPRGPSGCCQPGAVFLAGKSGCPVIAVGCSAAPRKLIKSWDRYLVPAPFARAAMVYGKPIYVTGDLKSPEEQAEWAAKIEAEINRVEAEAERLAGISLPDGNACQDAKQWHRA